MRNTILPSWNSIFDENNKNSKNGTKRIDVRNAVLRDVTELPLPLGKTRLNYATQDF